MRIVKKVEKDMVERGNLGDGLRIVNSEDKKFKRGIWKDSKE